MSNSVSRRSFLQKAAGATAGVAALKGFPNLNMSYGTGQPEGLPLVLCSGRKTWASDAAWDVLKDGGDALDAVHAGAMAAEVYPRDTSVGVGGLPNEEGVIQLDCSIMDGLSMQCGAVGALEGIDHPSTVARYVMERTDHIMIVGRDAQQFAVRIGLDVTDISSERSRDWYREWVSRRGDGDDWLTAEESAVKMKRPLPPSEQGRRQRELERTYGTINVLAVDVKGNVAGCTTTSGLSGKIPGRCGDSPIIGAGLYALRDVGAAGFTGRGEEVIRVCGSFTVCEMMRRGMPPKEACRESIRRMVEETNDGNAGFSDNAVAINARGEYGSFSVAPGYTYVIHNPGGQQFMQGESYRT
jgi:N4-(beta-N-acetylglucosaminyl)-L-asparaginase